MAARERDANPHALIRGGYDLTDLEEEEQEHNRRVTRKGIPHGLGLSGVHAHATAFLPIGQAKVERPISRPTQPTIFYRGSILEVVSD